MFPQTAKWKLRFGKTSVNVVKAVEGDRFYEGWPSMVNTFLRSPPWGYIMLSHRMDEAEDPAASISYCPSFIYAIL